MAITDPCDIDSFVEDMNKSLEKLTKDTVQTVDTLGFKIGFNFLVTAATMIAAIVGTTAMAVISRVVLDSAASLTGSVVSTLMASLSTIAGADLVFQYLLVRTLRDKLILRRQLINILMVDINNVIVMFRWFLSFSDKSPAPIFSDPSLIEALKYINAARNILTSEYNRTSSNGSQIKTVNKYTVGSARGRVLQAIDSLTKHYFLASYDGLAVLERKYSVRTKHPVKSNKYLKGVPGADMVAWYGYYGDLIDEMQKRNLEPRVYYEILQEFMPEFPKIIQGLVLQQMFGDSIEALLSKIPVMANLLTKLSKSLNVNSDLSIIGYPKPAKDPFFTATTTKNLTVKKLSDLIKITEASILSFPESYRELMFWGSWQLAIIKESIDDLKTRAEEVQDLIDNGGDWLDKFNIANDLMMTASMLESISGNGDKLKILGASTSGTQITDTMQTADEQLAELKNFIVLKSYDFQTNKPITAPVDTAFVLSKMLVPLAENMLLLLQPKKVKKMINYLQAIKILWQKQLRLDGLELSKCNAYISTMEANPAFMAVKKQVEGMLDTLASTPVGKVAESLAAGSIDEVLDAVQGVDTLAAVVQSGLCVESSIGTGVAGYLDSLTSAMKANPMSPSPDTRKIQNLMKEIKSAVATLNDQKDMLSDQLALVKSNIKRMEEQKSLANVAPIQGIDIKQYSGLNLT